MFNLIGQDIQSVREHIATRGIQYPNRYLVEFVPQGQLLNSANIRPCTMYPISVNLPEQTISEMTDQYYTTPRSIPTFVQTGMVLMNFILMQDWKERDFFEKWMNAISYGNYNNRPGYDLIVGSLPYDIASHCKMHIGLLNGSSPATINAKYNYSECYPIQLSPVEFDSTIGGYAAFQVGLSVRSLTVQRTQSSTN